MRTSCYLGIVILTVSLATARAGDDKTSNGVSESTGIELDLSAQTLSGQITPMLPGQAVPLLAGQLIQALPGQIVQSLPGQLVPSLPGQIGRPLPGQILSRVR